MPKKIDSIDRKFKIIAFNPVTKKVHTDETALLLCAHDAAVPAALRAYQAECINLGCGDTHIKSISLLIQRVEQFQANNAKKKPDTVASEYNRCVLGIAD